MKLVATIISALFFGNIHAAFLGPLHQCSVKLNQYIKIDFEIRDNLKAIATYKRLKDNKYLGSCQLSPITGINGMDGKTREIKLVYSSGKCDLLDQSKYPIKEEPTFRLRLVSSGYNGLLFIQKNRHPLECRSDKTNIKKWYQSIEKLTSHH